MCIRDSLLWAQLVSLFSLFAVHFERCLVNVGLSVIWQANDLTVIWQAIGLTAIWKASSLTTVCKPSVGRISRFVSGGCFFQRLDNFANVCSFKWLKNVLSFVIARFYR